MGVEEQEQRRNESPGSPFWYRAGVNPAGVLALAAGFTTSALCVDTLYTGPVAALTGVDLALPVGMLVAAAVYAPPDASSRRAAQRLTAGAGRSGSRRVRLPERAVGAAD
ncbi:hypothetical protein ACGF12_15315 [Kitasatospora sp. NPDC048296]|uniref:hypothetical protein n=1 Tax=Kitasatospora sp. NPDC048296 TaxID=3364048 RepID=UPI003710A4EB